MKILPRLIFTHLRLSPAIHHLFGKAEQFLKLTKRIPIFLGLSKA
jgi:hypothetical protein